MVFLGRSKDLYLFQKHTYAHIYFSVHSPWIAVIYTQVLGCSESICIFSCRHSYIWRLVCEEEKCFCQQITCRVSSGRLQKFKNSCGIRQRCVWRSFQWHSTVMKPFRRKFKEMNITLQEWVVVASSTNKTTSTLHLVQVLLLSEKLIKKQQPLCNVLNATGKHKIKLLVVDKAQKQGFLYLSAPELSDLATMFLARQNLLPPARCEFRTTPNAFKAAFSV